MKPPTLSLRPSLRLLAHPSRSTCLLPLLPLLPPNVPQSRSLHKTRPAHPIPPPRPFVPDVPTFLTLIGRGLHRHASKFPTWESLFSLTSPELKALGIEPVRSRRYLLQWMERYRNGALGPGGDFEFVKDGQALLKVATPPASVVSDAKWVVNVPSGDGAGDAAGAKSDLDVQRLPRPKGYVVRGLNEIAGPYARALPGDAGAVVKVIQGMWEQRRRKKIDGGERRRAEIRFKRRSAERREEREAEAAAKM
ncbi:hypothetical protein E4U41_007679 [Claviceps citrina]|nr:hypothetical protein E4U41_007679 [Claviceps citrina]